jgi:hypothetical protein
MQKREVWLIGIGGIRYLLLFFSFLFLRVLQFCPGCGSPQYSLWGGWKLACSSLLPWADNSNRKRPCPSGYVLSRFPLFPVFRLTHLFLCVYPALFFLCVYPALLSSYVALSDSIITFTSIIFRYPPIMFYLSGRGTFLPFHLREPVCFQTRRNKTENTFFLLSLFISLTLMQPRAQNIWHTFLSQQQRLTKLRSSPNRCCRHHVYS